MKNYWGSEHLGVRLHRPCRKCGEKFLPTGKWCRVCMDCLHELYNQKVERMQEIRAVPV